MKKLFYPREWFFIAMQLTAAGSFGWAIFNYHSLEYWVISILGYFLITCLGITVTFHRLLTHRSYKLWKPLEYLFSYFGNIGCTGSSVGWVFVHREHHKYADKIGDPHSPVILNPLGAFIGNYSTSFNKWSVKEIINDPVHRFMHEYYIFITLLTVMMLYFLDPFLALHLFFIPIFLNTMASRLSNWIDHDSNFGTKDMETNDSSHNVWWWSLLTFGEGWHNNHHARPWDYQIGKKWYQIDIGRYVIDILIILKLAKVHENYKP